MLRRVLFWIHLCTGCVAGLIILIMCVTGIGLAFERQINNLVDRWNCAALKPGPVRLAIDEVIRILPTDKAGLTGITQYSDPDQPLAFSFGRDRIIFVDPYSGKILGESSRNSRAFFGVLERWHRALGAELRRRGPRRALADAANFAFLILIMTGAVLWWPKKWSRQRLNSVALFRRNLAGKPALWNRHNVAGIWSAVPLFLIVLTGVVMSYTWANNALYRLAGSEPPAANGGAQERGGASTRSNSKPNRGADSAVETRVRSVQALFDRATLQVNSWQSVNLRWAPGSRTAVFTIDRGNGGQPNKRDQLTLDAATGETRIWEPFATNSAGRRLRSLARFVHTGEAGGIIGQAIAAIATLGGVLLVWTGLRMAWIRARSFVLTRSHGRVPAFSQVNER